MRGAGKRRTLDSPARDGAGAAVEAGGQVLGAAGVLGGRHGDELRERAEDEDLGDAEGGDLGEGAEAGADVRELHGAVQVDGAREGHAELLHEHADERHHRDAAVLDLNGAAARERGDIVAQAERVEKAEGAGRGEGRWEGSGEWGVRALARRCATMRRCGAGCVAM